MLAAGRLRVLGANDPDPYPDAITISLDDIEDDDSDEACTVTRGGRRKRKTAIQKAIENLSA